MRPLLYSFPPDQSTILIQVIILPTMPHVKTVSPETIWACLKFALSWKSRPRSEDHREKWKPTFNRKILEIALYYFYNFAMSKKNLSVKLDM